jgi:hypothetical protein
MLIMPILIAALFGLAYLVWSISPSLVGVVVFFSLIYLMLLMGGYELFDHIISQR